MVIDMDTKLNALQEINAGVTAERVELALKEVAIGVANTGNKGKVTVTFDISSQKNSECQVNIDAIVLFKKPNSKGFTSEQRKDGTSMFVSKFGLSTMPEQPGLNFDNDEKVTQINNK